MAFHGIDAAFMLSPPTNCWPEEILEKMWPLPISELFMVGRATAPKQQRLNIMTIGDVALSITRYLPIT
jgi:nucleotidyltransferase/DNA polymerase involved in DNA repair